MHWRALPIVADVSLSIINGKSSSWLSFGHNWYGHKHLTYITCLLKEKKDCYNLVDNLEHSDIMFLVQIEKLEFGLKLMNFPRH